MQTLDQDIGQSIDREVPGKGAEARGTRIGLAPAEPTAWHRASWSQANASPHAADGSRAAMGEAANRLEATAADRTTLRINGSSSSRPGSVRGRRG